MNNFTTNDESNIIKKEYLQNKKKYLQKYLQKRSIFKILFFKSVFFLPQFDFL